MRQIVAVLNLRNYLRPASRGSILAAAKRWGAEYLEITKPIEPGKHHFWQKSILHRRITGDAHVLQLDADMLVRHDCPSPFPLCPPHTLGLVRVNPHWGRWVGGRSQCIRFWAEKMGIPPLDVHTEYPNTGFVLYSTAHHRALFNRVYMQGAPYNWCKDGLPDQTVLALMVRHEGWPVRWLPTIFNTCGVDRHPEMSIRGPMTTYIYHFCGPGRWIMPRMRWKAASPQFGRVDEILNRLPEEDPVTLIEIGVAWGRMSSRLLACRPNLHLTMIDPWTTVGPRHRYYRSGDTLARRDQRRHDSDLEAAMRETEFALDRRTMFYCTSMQAAGRIENHSQDMVFVDGDHTEPGVTEDLNVFASKVKPGGYIGGHDYGRWGVKQAVDAFVEENGLTLERGGDLTWFVRLDKPFPPGPFRSREIARRIPRDRPFKMIEVGVNLGVNANAILQRRPELELTGLDLWERPLPQSYVASDDKLSKHTTQQRTAIREQAEKRLAWCDRVTLLQEESLEALQRFEDRSLDGVFIDGDHSYPGCARDIAAWVEKVKPGGWIGGHDYGHRGPTGKWGVKRAVDEFVKKHGLRLELGQDLTWFTQIPSEGLPLTSQETNQ